VTTPPASVIFTCALGVFSFSSMLRQVPTGDICAQAADMLPAINTRAATALSSSFPSPLYSKQRMNRRMQLLFQ
jgi:hypothetical protein